MRKIKNYFVPILALFCLTRTISSGAQTIFETKGSTNFIVLDIPTEHLSKLKNVKRLNDPSFYTETRFVQSLNGYVSVVFDKDEKVIRITAPECVKKDALLRKSKSIRPIGECYKDCIGASESAPDSHPLLCYWICVMESSL